MKRKGLFGLFLTLILSASFLSLLSLPKNTVSVGASDSPLISEVRKADIEVDGSGVETYYSPVSNQTISIVLISLITIGSVTMIITYVFINKRK